MTYCTQVPTDQCFGCLLRQVHICRENDLDSEQQQQSPPPVQGSNLPQGDPTTQEGRGTSRQSRRPRTSRGQGRGSRQPQGRGDTGEQVRSTH